MGVYLKVEEIFSKMVQDILSSENLLKLLRYDVYDPLAEATIADPHTLIYIGNNEPDEDVHRIYLPPKIPELNEYQKSFIVPTMTRVRPTQNATKVNIEMSFLIAVHVSRWAIKQNGIRIFKIMELLNNLYEKNYDLKAINYPLSTGSDFIKINDNWRGYDLKYKFTNWNVGFGDS